MLSTYIGPDDTENPTKLVLRLLDTSPPIEYSFAGRSLDEQAANVRLFAQSMSGGEGELAANLGQYLEDIDIENFEDGMVGVVRLLFGGSDWLVTEEVAGIIGESGMIYGAEDGASLLGELDEVGDILLAVLL